MRAIRLPRAVVARLCPSAHATGVWRAAAGFALDGCLGRRRMVTTPPTRLGGSPASSLASETSASYLAREELAPGAGVVSKGGGEGERATASATAHAATEPARKPASATVGAAAAGTGGLDLGDLIITKAAARHIATVRTLEQKGEDKRPVHLRVTVEAGGCSGFQYHLQFTRDGVQPEDLVFTRDGAEVLVDAVSLDLIRGSTLDFEDSLMRSGLSIVNNPNSEGGCGCGTSFARKDA